jgi:hypothetical protein
VEGLALYDQRLADQGLLAQRAVRGGRGDGAVVVAEEAAILEVEHRGRGVGGAAGAETHEFIFRWLGAALCARDASVVDAPAVGQREALGDGAATGRAFAPHREEVVVATVEATLETEGTLVEEICAARAVAGEA